MDSGDKRIIFVLYGFWLTLLGFAATGIPYGVWPPFIIMLCIGFLGHLVAFLIWISGKIFRDEY